MTILVPLLAALVGLVLYVLATHPKLAEVGRLLFGAGALVALFVLAHSKVQLLP